MSMPPSNFEYPQQPLDYARALPVRPGILTAVGVISIIVGSLSALGSVSGILTGIMYIAMSKMPFPTPTITTTTTATTASASGTASATTIPAASANPSPTTIASSAITSSASNTASGGSSSNTSNMAMSVNVTNTGNGTVVTSTTTGVGPAFNFNIAPGASELTITEGILSLCAAVVLIFAGSLMLRDSPKAWRLHRIFVLLKFPLIFVAAFATYWTTSGLMSSFNVNMGPTPNIAPAMHTMAITQAIFLGVFSLIYPVALLIVLATKTSKSYFKKITGVAE